MKLNNCLTLIGLALMSQQVLYAQSSIILNERLEYPIVSGYQTNTWPGSWGWYNTTNTWPNTSGMDNVMAHSGNESLYWNDIQGSNYESIFLKGVNVGFTTNDVATATFWLRSDPMKPYNGSCVFVCSMEFHNTGVAGDPTINAATTFVTPDQISTNGWTQYSVSGSPTAYANQIMFVMKSSNFGPDVFTNASGILYFDDLQLTGTYAEKTPGNILVNNSFESKGFGWTLVHPQGAGGAVFESTGPTNGSFIFKCWGTGNPTNIQSIVQTRSVTPGYSYNAGGDARNGYQRNDTISSPSQFWLQVDFLDASSNVLTSYESARLGSTANSYYMSRCDITNQVNPTTRALIGNVTNMVAPTGAASVRFSGIYSQNTSGGGSVQFDNMFLVQNSGAIPPMVENVIPDGSMLLNDASDGMRFNATSSVTNIDASGVQLILNGVDVSSGLTISGSGSNNLSVVYSELQPNVQYTAVLNVTDEAGATSSTTVNFDTYSIGNVRWEGEDYDYGGGQYINNPEPLAMATGSYQNLAGVQGVDYYESGPWGGDSTLRESYGVGPGITGCADTARYYDVDAGVSDYCIGWFNGGIANGDWVNYTRSVPAGSYNVVCRLSSIQGPGAVQLAVVTSGAGTANQETNVLGTVSVNSMGNWTYATVVGTNGSPVTLDYTNVSNVVTYRVSATTNADINFFMLVPVAPKNPVQLSVNWVAGQPVISFPSQSQATYSLQYKNNLTDTSWTTLPGSVTGDGTTKYITDTTATGTQRFYRVMIQ